MPIKENSDQKVQPELDNSIIHKKNKKEIMDKQTQIWGGRKSKAFFKNEDVN